MLRRPGHTEAAVDLARLAGLRPAGVLCELVNDDGTMMRLPDLRRFADEHGLALITIADLIAYRRPHEQQVERVAEARLPTEYGVFRAVGYRAAHRRRRARRAGLRRPRRRRGRAGPGALRVPDRRRVRLAALRLRSAAAGGPAPGRRGGARRRALRARPRGPGHRADAQAAGVPAAGPGPRHRRRQPRARACRPTPATTAPARRSWPTSASARCGCSPTTRPSGPGWRGTG